MPHHSAAPEKELMHDASRKLGEGLDQLQRIHGKIAVASMDWSCFGLLGSSPKRPWDDELGGGRSINARIAVSIDLAAVFCLRSAADVGPSRMKAANGKAASPDP